MNGADQISDFKFIDFTDLNKKEIIKTYITMFRDSGIDLNEKFLTELNEMDIEKLNKHITELRRSF